MSQSVNVVTDPSHLLEIAMSMSDQDKTLGASFTFNPELAPKTANLFMAKYPDARASCGTIKAMRTALRRVPVADTERPYTLVYLEESNSFILGRAKKVDRKKEELSAEQREELDYKALKDIVSRQGRDFLLNFLLATEEEEQEEEIKEAA